MNVISGFSTPIPLNTFSPSNSKSSYLIELVGSNPTVENANLEKFPVASVLIPWNPKQPANRMDLLKDNINNIICQFVLLTF